MSDEQEELNLGDAIQDLDTIDVPDEQPTIRFEKEAEAAKDDQAEAEEAKPEETKEERRQRKRNDYQKRLNELTREKHEEREARAAAEARAELAEQRLQEMEKAGRESTKSILTQREQELIEKRRKAEEDGDMAAYSVASDELFDVRGRMREPEPEPERQQAPRKQAPSNDMVPEASEWLGANAWFVDQANSHLADEVLRIQAELVTPRSHGGRGYDLNNSEQAKKVYAEIDRRIRELPEFDAVLGIEHEEEAEEPERKPAPRSHIAPPSRGGEALQRVKPGELGKHDISAIKAAGLDPNDPKVRATYIKYNRKAS